MSEQLDQLQNLLASLKHWKGKITEALSHSHHTHTFDDVVGMILQNRILFFARDDAFVIMEEVAYPQFKVFHCFLAGGEMEAVLSMQQDMEKIGRNLGCKYLSIAGRTGWQRVLKDHGWEHVCTTMYKPLEEVTDGKRKRWPADLNGQAPARNH